MAAKKAFLEYNARSMSAGCAFMDDVVFTCRVASSELVTISVQTKHGQIGRGLDRTEVEELLKAIGNHGLSLECIELKPIMRGEPHVTAGWTYEYSHFCITCLGNATDTEPVFLDAAAVDVLTGLLKANCDLHVRANMLDNLEIPAFGL